MASLLPAAALAQGTKLWSTSRYDEMERSTNQGVAIRGDGRLEPGPLATPVYTSGGNYIWSLAADAKGVAYVGLGGTASGSAAVMRVTPDGKSTKIFSGKEIAVQALRLLPDGGVLVATSPDGKLYRVAPDGAGTPAILFDPAETAEKPKYIWDAVVIGKAVYVAAGAPAAVYRVDLSHGAPVSRLLFKTADQHIRTLLATPDGTLWAGSDGAGVIYKISTTQPDAKPFAIYAAPRREITALAIDPAGVVYAAGVGAKGAPSLPPLPVTGAVGVSITFVQPGSASAAGSNTLIPEGSEIYRIGADGLPSRFAALKDDVVYALGMHDGALLAATGNHGRIYKFDTHGNGAESLTDLVHLEAAQAMALAPVAGGVLVASSNSGKLFRVPDAPAPDAAFTSEVFDAQQFSRWGRPEVRSASPASFDLLVRGGNVPNPIDGWSDWKKVTPNEDSLAASGVPDARYIQWKAVLKPGGSLQGVALNYLPRNVAPVVDDVVVAPGARVAATAATTPNQTVQVTFPAANVAQAIGFVQDAGTQPLSAQKDRTGITIRWSAHDDNGDDLMFAVWYRGEGEQTWRLLKDRITDKFYSFDSVLLPDGVYTAKIVASDAPVHVDADTLTGERASGAFTIDTTPPVPGALVAKLQAGKIHAAFDAKDATSPIAHAEYAIDGGAWQYLEPAGHLSDSLAEHYDFTADLPKPEEKTGDHVIAIRVYDRFENMAAAKAVVHE
ncbi:WD40 repeat domain-containing protein [Granulicella rosea]|uniref:WD40 repeat domain-containing protein n=1 Tax=Granulicella rosea TaxID=474952 RepID=UPI001FE73573|nr:WD40 repeat domain-containing protein [Granulicella rosea]